jgi:hypothetical protein
MRFLCKPSVSRSIKLTNRNGQMKNRVEMLQQDLVDLDHLHVAMEMMMINRPRELVAP